MPTADATYSTDATFPTDGTVSAKDMMGLPDLDSITVDRFRRRMTNPFLMRLFMLVKMPLGFFAGMCVKEIDTERCQTVIRYGWRNTNPFRSMYFAAQSMTAELSTGAIAMLAVELAPQSVAMLITGLETTFGKKATGVVTFTCEDGEKIFAAVRQTLATGEAATAAATTIGRMADGTEVSRFVFTWSFKKRSFKKRS